MTERSHIKREIQEIAHQLFLLLWSSQSPSMGGLYLTAMHHDWGGGSRTSQSQALRETYSRKNNLKTKCFYVYLYHKAYVVYLFCNIFFVLISKVKTNTAYRFWETLSLFLLGFLLFIPPSTPPQDSLSEGWRQKRWYLVFHIISNRHGVM